MSNTPFLDKEIQNIKTIHERLTYLAGAKNVEEVEMKLTGEEITSLHAALGAVITYYMFTKSIENDPTFKIVINHEI